MANAFQSTAFQVNAFQAQQAVSTLNLQLPINCVLIGDQVAIILSGEERPERPSFNVTTSKRGYT